MTTSWLNTLDNVKEAYNISTVKIKFTRKEKPRAKIFKSEKFEIEKEVKFLKVKTKASVRSMGTYS